MCSEYILKTRIEEFQDAFEDMIVNLSGAQQWERRVRLSERAPLIELQNDKLVLTEAQFPAPPPFPNSRISDLKIDYKTGEEKLMRIYELPTWKRGFTEARCLIPLTAFVEPAYWGPSAGSAMTFSSQEDPVLFVAGIRILNPKSMDKTGAGFSLITHTASKQMLEYHQRLVVLLKAKDGLQWIQNDGTPEEKLKFLLEKRYMPTFAVDKDRNLAKVWEKKKDLHAQKLSHEKSYAEFLQIEGLRG